ncbi:alpha/beta fold hydrolase [Kribbella shirazensis]|uniref:Pimeloyl-ACP methyl ester carboxylesterase n=1 Tax=Kribbella shirazensis TaxID=1105143 RepID=A0A7X5VHL3_9ACTN|nr:alpha/beta hydrolase [Kribbella shirazensis]NIK61363.1 pimeloyl-ACP methyl ester carboxylesterase [Kribbella shirazensis]
MAAQAAPATATVPSVTRGHAPQGPGSVSGAPHLPPGFRTTFTSRYIDIGDVRLHAVIGGRGRPLLLVHGWPQTWYAWRMLMPALAREFQVIAVDQRGIGLSDKPLHGYDTATQADDLVALMEALGHQRFAVYGTDTGLSIAYALAADHRDRIDRLIVSEASVFGVSPSPALFQPPDLNARLWHLAFNQLPAHINEALVRGREDIFFGAEFDVWAGVNKLPEYAVNYYIRILQSGRDALRGSFGWYRAIPESAAQNKVRAINRLTLPVLAIVAQEGVPGGAAMAMSLVADDVQGVNVPNGHWVAEQAPNEVLSALTSFLAPYRSGPVR